MCGIVAYVGERTAYPILIKGLQRLEYRGYDSAGIALMNDDMHLYKCKGKVKDLENLVKGQQISGSIGMGHTRWATHGKPSDLNAHPHQSQDGKFVVIHNGIIENYNHLKKELINRGYEFKTETDTEVLANLIENIYNEKQVPAELAVRLALTKVVGAYGLVIACKDEPGRLIGARKGSPLVIGIGEKEYFLASDATPIIEYTDQVVFMNDEEVAVIDRDSFELKNLHNDTKTPQVQKIELSIDEIDKGDYDHFMLKEIHDQPASIEDTFRGRISMDRSKIFLGGILDVMPDLIKARRIIIIACGTSWHAGLVGEYLFEEYARIPVEVEYGSEFRYRKPILYPDDVVIAISQSGETADTLAALRMVREQSEATILGICNVTGSSISRETDAGVYTHAGIEIGVASTKAFTAQITVLTMMAFLMGHRRKTISDSEYLELVNALTQVPDLMRRILEHEGFIKDVAEGYTSVTNALYLGRGLLYPVALEGALKLKEISYIHAEGYPAAEMKHGPIALIDENMPVFVLAIKDDSYEKIISNIQEIKARNGKVVAIVTEGEKTIKKMADHVIEIPACHKSLSPLLAVVPLQVVSYYIAVKRGCNVDQPRNLAKSVTVE